MEASLRVTIFRRKSLLPPGVSCVPCPYRSGGFAAQQTPAEVLSAGYVSLKPPFNGHPQPGWRREKSNQESCALTEEEASEHSGHAPGRWNKEPSGPARRGWATAGLNGLHTRAHTSDTEVLVPSRKGALREQSLKMQFSPEVLFSPLRGFELLNLCSRMERTPSPDSHSHRSRGGMRRIHSHEDQLLSLWTLGCGGPSQELSSLVSYAGA